MHWFRESNGLWSGQIINDPGHDGWDNSIFLETNDLLHTSSIDPIQFEGGGVEYAFFDGSQWTVESIGSDPVEYQFSTSIQVDTEGDPHITYFDSPGSQSLKLASRKEGNWIITAVDLDPMSGLFASLVLNENDRPAISYLADPTTTGVFEVRFAALIDDLWQIETVDILSGIEIAFEGARNVTSLVLRDGIYHLSYGDKSVIRYAQKSDLDWMIEDVVEAEENITLGQQTSMALTSDNSPIIVYFEVTGSQPLTGKVKIASKQSVTGIDDEVSESKINIYPNPAQTGFYVEHLQPRGHTIKITLLDVTGKVLKSRSEAPAKDPIYISTTSYEPGIYLIHVRSGKEGMVRKTIVLK